MAVEMETDNDASIQEFREFQKQKQAQLDELIKSIMSEASDRFGVNITDVNVHISFYTTTTGTPLSIFRGTAIGYKL